MQIKLECKRNLQRVGLIQYFAPLKLFLYHDAMTTKQRFCNKYRLQLREKYHEPMQVHLVGGILMLKGASKNPIF